MMSSALALSGPPVTSHLLRPLLGSRVTVHTASRTVRGTLLSCVKGSAWFVVEDADVLVHLDDIVSVDTG